MRLTSNHPSRETIGFGSFDPLDSFAALASTALEHARAVMERATGTLEAGPRRPHRYWKPDL
jgi:hypothetical protein